MGFDLNSDFVVAIQRQSAQGVLATDDATAQVMSITDSPGMGVDRTQIQSQVKRRDKLKPMGRLGSQKVPGSFNGEVMVGGFIDLLAESIQRGTWSAATVLVTVNNGAALTSIQATATNQLTLVGTGSFITQGVKVGDVLTPANMTNAANSNVRGRVKTVAANVLTFFGTPFVVEGAASTTVTLTRAKKVSSPAVPNTYYHTIDQYYAAPGMDKSELFSDCVLTGFSFSFKPDSMATFTATFTGLQHTTLVSGTSPYFTVPTVLEGLSLVADDSQVSYAGTDLATLTGFDLNFQIDATVPAVLGSVIGPAVLDHDLTVSGTVTMMRSDLSNIDRYKAETEFAVSILLTEPTADPKPFFGIWISRAKLGKVDAPVGGGDGAKTETLTLMTGPLKATTTADAGVAAFFSSAA